MTCREFEKNLNDWRGEEGPLARALEPHARQCADCRLKLELQAELVSSLARLARSTGQLEPPESVERQLRHAFRTRRSRPAGVGTVDVRSWRRWGAAAAGVLLLVTLGVQVGRIMNRPAEVTGSSPAGLPTGASPEEEQGRVAVGSDFIPIGGCFDPDCLRNSQLMRVRIPRSSLLQFGLPMNPELAESEVLADVLVSEDGSAQAIRFVNY